ncbi:MAG TPA: hypothetical protein VGS12_11790 [Caulobacteraceae bacterium]|nr:hypothetical protein [Caulobacteraceae bacterium]
MSGPSPGDRPVPEMLAAAEAVARFIETGEESFARQAFGPGPATIVENFAPFLFDGEGAIASWVGAMRDHVRGLSELRHSFGPATDYGRCGERAYFSLPTTWSGRRDGTRFTETGGWSFVLEGDGGSWRVLAYGWAVTGLETTV